MIVGQPGENAGSQEYLVYIACAAFFLTYINERLIEFFVEADQQQKMQQYFEVIHRECFFKKQIEKFIFNEALL